MERTDLVVPAALVAGLDIPPLAVTTGEPDVVWVEIPTSTWRFSTRPAQRLPLDPVSARHARRFRQLTPWSAVTALAQVAAAVAVYLTSSIVASAVLIALLAGSLVLTRASVGGRLPDQTPSRNRAGDLRIPHVPVAVARQWQERNPGVRGTDQPAPRAYSRRFYAAWSGGLLLAALALATVPAWPAVIGLVLAGVVVAGKLLPPGYIRFE